MNTKFKSLPAMIFLGNIDTRTFSECDHCYVYTTCICMLKEAKAFMKNMPKRSIKVFL